MDAPVPLALVRANYTTLNLKRNTKEKDDASSSFAMAHEKMVERYAVAGMHS